jgi:hypothetical protein
MMVGKKAEIADCCEPPPRRIQFRSALLGQTESGIGR